LSLAAQAQLPRTPDGKPDLQGTWDFRTITPLERPNQFAGKETLSAEEVEALEQRTAETRVDRAPRTGDPGTYNQFWFDFGNRVVDDKRTSLIVDPADGRRAPNASSARPRDRKIGRPGSGACSGSTPARRSCQAATTTTSTWCRRAITWWS
jgi:hypothetical protein